ncbi:MAG: BsuBI/PstI family type II restriction endonuclease [Pseudomonadota bacterium]
MTLLPLLNRDVIRERLFVIFPEGAPERDKCVRGAAAATVFALLYVGAVEGADRWLGPVHVVRMSDAQARKDTDKERLDYWRHPKLIGERWYQENSREQVRDEVLRQGLIPNNAVVERAGLPTTSSAPRYALRPGFAALFDPSLDNEALSKQAEKWRAVNMAAAVLARIKLLRRGAAANTEGVLVRFPNGETRRMAAGLSSEISRAVIEEFAPRFLVNPAVLWLSESREKVVARDDRLAADLRLEIDPGRNLPDVILVDLGQEPDDFLIVFVEVVATDGAMTPQRVNALLSMATAAGYGPDQVAFVTAYFTRSRTEFKKTIPSLAWHSFAWFVAEPDQVIVLHDGSRAPVHLKKLLRF